MHTVKYWSGKEWLTYKVYDNSAEAGDAAKLLSVLFTNVEVHAWVMDELIVVSY